MPAEECGGLFPRVYLVPGVSNLATIIFGSAMSNDFIVSGLTGVTDVSHLPSQTTWRTADGSVVTAFGSNLGLDATGTYFGTAEDLQVVDPTGHQITLRGVHTPLFPLTSGFEMLSFLGGNDILMGSAGVDLLNGGGGADKIYGGAGDDWLYGYASGPATESGNPATENDTLFGGDGDDHMFAGAGNDVMYGGNGKGFFYGQSGNDIMYGGASFDAFDGGTGNDAMYGGDGSDYAKGEEGNDLLSGDAGGDLLLGNEGNDTLFGGTGNDILNGGLGVDRLYGGAQFDRFVYESTTDSMPGMRDQIMDFQRGMDKIDLMAIDANTMMAGNQAFKFMGMGALDGMAGELKFVMVDMAGTANDRTIVSGDVNGDGKADFQVELIGLMNLRATDFVL